MRKRQEFALTNSYKDETTNYYIKYVYNPSTLSYSETRLIQQLYLVENFTVGRDMETNDQHIASDVSTKIYNETLGQPIQRSNYFDIIEEDASVGDIDFSNVKIVGKLTGTQLMKLQTIIYIQGKEIVWDYYFVISVEIWSDEETPTTIYSGEKFVEYLTKSERPDDYILMADIDLNDYTPLDTDLINSLDGNGFTININSFKTSAEDTALTLALFNNVNEDTLLKNVRVNIYNGGQINVNIRQYSSVNIAGFAIQNEGIIYNCEVVSYYDTKSPYMTSNSGETGLYVQYTNGNNTDPIILTSDILNSNDYALNSSTISGFVETNIGQIVNSRVGGEKIQRIVEISGINYIQTENLGTFTILGQGDVAGFVNRNSGYISASFADNVQIYNRMNSITSKTAGFALTNSKSIETSYVEGVRKYNSDASVSSNDFVITGSTISARGIIAGFVYENNNNGLIENSYSNIAIDNAEMSCEYAAGFVYTNQANSVIRLCYSACEINTEDINQMQFSGVYNATSRNFGTIESSYYYATSTTSDSNQKRVEPSVLAIDDPTNEDSFYGFSFASSEVTYDGIWKIDRQTGITLVSANEKALSNRYAVTTNGSTSVYYSNRIVDLSTMNYVNLSYGSRLNPIIIRSAAEFAKATGKATSKEVSAFKEFYTNTDVFGNYRLVRDIDLSDLEDEVERTTLTTTSKTFSGILDGNGFTISGIELGSEEEVENYGLFARLNGAAVMGLNMEVVAVNNTKANIVGSLAGTVINSRISSVELAFGKQTSSSSNEEKMIAGQNVVGGLVGMVFGDSKLSDISVSGVEVFSSYSDEQKTIRTNRANTGDNLRRYIDSNSSLKPFVRQISYAGAVAGYVDIYDGTLDYALINLSYGMSDYNVVTVRVKDSVNIYAEVTGLFGYVGRSTLIYDSSLELNSSTASTNPSYIISRNLYSGGLIGENYGGMFAVSASYGNALQDSIEEKENNYYSSVNSSNERGQISVFSYTNTPVDEEELKKSRANDPLFIGGLIGYMGGGYIYVGNSKLNVVANETTNFCRHTLAAGGIIGYAGEMDFGYNITFAENNPKVNLVLHDVYSSGDVYVANGVGVGAGIIGALDGSVVVGLKNVNALNYYSFNTNSVLNGDVNVNVVDNAYTSDKHFTLIGNIYNWYGSNNDGHLEKGTTSSSIYLITNQSFYGEVTSGLAPSQGSLTVGGYTTLKVGSNTVNLRPFGFNYAQDENNPDKSNVVVDVDHIGNSSMNSMSVAYSTFNSFFVKKGWNSNYWVHDQDKLFPHIELHPQTNLLFWDYYNTDEMLDLIANGNSGNLTIVLRGKYTSDENDKTYVDIDLRGSNEKVLNGFSGKLISYYAFTGTHEEATVKRSTSGGGNVDEDVGIIIDRPIFANIKPTANIQGITFYMSPQTDGGKIDYQLTNNSEGLKNVTFKDIKLVLNSKVELTARNVVSGGSFGTGLIANYASATTFDGILIDSSRLADNNVSDIVLKASNDNDVYLGVLVGKLEQNTLYDSMNMTGVSFRKVKSSKIYTTSVEFDYGTAKDAYLGLYAGEISKTSTAPFTVGLTQFGKIDISVTSTSTSTDKVFVGGYAGQLSGVNDVSLVSDENSAETFITIKQKNTIKNLYAGLGFGSINSTVNIQSGSGRMTLSGGIYQVGDVKTGVANIGGFAGQTRGSVTINGLSLNFNVG
ncbi:MAG: hypothetical protein K2K31_03190, partial [Clostridia bacterium]|nr:hypothetical protein [Clostridia bacterium]